MNDQAAPAALHPFQLPPEIEEYRRQVLDDAIQIHGAMGEALELPLSLFYRYVRHARIGGGTDEIQRMMIARMLLK